MVSRHEVEMAYRLIMGREVESEQSIEGHLRHRSVEDMRRSFFSSEEFRTKVIPGFSTAGRPLTWPPIRVDTDVSDDQLAQMIERVERNFQHMGETEPYWSVITADRFRVANIQTSEAEFFNSGQGVVNDFILAAERSGLALADCPTCFELGCGLGRSTIWLAEHFEHVIGTDISRSHLEIAAQALERFGKKDKVELLHIASISQIAELPDFDAFFSIIVLQHNPPPLIKFLLRVIFSKLRPGGLAYFQVPTYALGYSFDVNEYLVTEVKLGSPEMHVLPQSQLFKLVAECGCELLEIREDGAPGGAQFISNRLLVQKRPS